MSMTQREYESRTVFALEAIAASLAVIAAHVAPSGQCAACEDGCPCRPAVPAQGD